MAPTALTFLIPASRELKATEELLAHDSRHIAGVVMRYQSTNR